MSCDLTLGRVEPCKDSIGGIKAVYFINYGDATITSDVTDDTLIDDLGAISVYKYELKGTNQFDQNITSSRENGTTYFEQVLGMMLKKQDSTTSKEVKIMAYGRPQIVIHYRNGDAVLAGEQEGCEVTGGSIVSGTAQADLNGYNLTFTGTEPLYARHLMGATVDDPFAGLTTTPTVV
jgi:hypothetical protein